MRDVVESLQALLARRLPAEAQRWQARAVGAAGPLDRQAFLVDFAGAARWLGKARLGLDDGERTALAASGVEWPLGGWGLDDLGRVIILLRASVRMPDAELEPFAAELYAHGDTDERRAVLRALPLLPGPARFVALAADACRTSVVPLFEAIACENPYPAAHFPALNFNQMALKAVFLGIALERIVGLERRITPELVRMAEDYASERRAAGRSVPADLELIMRGGER